MTSLEARLSAPADLCPVCEGRPRDVRSEQGDVCGTCREKATLAVATWDSEGEALYRDDDFLDELMSMADEISRGERT